ncbi:MAG: histidinol-phosphatase [Desulfobacterales bacterium]|nr:histidinol-phosphatase [Desulfobacterales bacterium]MCP4162003.1 histidinol-phosphatase [Deltaproteobacteria bacterium]
MIDYHLHTPFCNHATGSMRDYIESAIKKGLAEICFLDHLILAKDLKVPSMIPCEVPLYFLSISELKNCYKDKIKIRSGLEVDFFENKMDIIEEITGEFAFDVIAGSVHFIEIDGKLINIASRRSLDARKNIHPDVIRKKYFEKLNLMIECDYFDTVCHLDLIDRFKHSDGNTSGYRDILKKIKKKDKVLEINTGGYSHKKGAPYPSFDIIKMCYEEGVKVTLGSDAHKPIDVGSKFKETISIVKSIGYKNITGFNKQNSFEIKI